MRNKQLVRVLKIFNLLRAAKVGYTIDQIHEMVTDLGYGATQRTIYRDLAALEESGCFVVATPINERGKLRYKINE